MIRSCLGSSEILKNRPYFGGIKSDQIRSVFEISSCKWGRNVLSFNVYSGVDGLYHIVSCPFKMEDSCWYIFLEEIGLYNRTNGDIKIKLDKFSIVCYPDGEWEKEWCLIKTSARNLKELRKLCSINIADYFPQYY
ncbi:MAG: hypothetical protein WC320_02135 [Candidatus Paceibacterota bacterium]|jgi:hypothetical protein